MYSFGNDYSEGACVEVIDALIRTNNVQSVGYGLDQYCEEAKLKIKKAMNFDKCDIHFLVGGTQANTIIINSMLRPFEAVISANSGHINVHETGAIEATGHKVLIADSKDGKVLPAGVEKVVRMHTDEHMVKPKMVYISNATEIGTVYTKQELKELSEVCKKYDLYLFMDGARLAQALVCKESDLTLNDCCTYCDVFYIGGTKNGALFGEAVVLINDSLKSDFRFHIKQRGGMLAKGRLLGVQFDALFTNEVYLKNGKHAVIQAQRIQDAFIDAGYSLFIQSPTNQIFPILSADEFNALKENHDFQIWEELENGTAVRFVTSWACDEQKVDTLIADIYSCKNR